MWGQVVVTAVVLYAINSAIQLEFPVYHQGLVVISGASSGIGRRLLLVLLLLLLLVPVLLLLLQPV